MKIASPSPMRSLFFGTIAVCGIGRPSGCRKMRGHGEPIGEPTDEGGLGGRANERNPESRLRHQCRGDEQRRHAASSPVAISRFLDEGSRR